ncbi:hypothetical protein [Nonomuraea sp. NPDC050783]|uniref:hypothetical protein n=1 Tax=Nonomuraea sp. NPDC050783 TaxID=3154634 RepID=UPI0034666FCF
MFTVEGEELISQVRDLREVSFVNMEQEEGRVMAEVLRRFVPDVSEVPPVPVAAFGNFI